MASIVKEKNGRKRIDFVDADGKRPKIRLGQVSMESARQWKTKVERLLEAKIGQFPLDRETMQWVSNLDERMAQRLAKLGLIRAPEKREELRLKDFLDGYVEKRSDVKLSTKTNWSHTTRSLVEFFGPDRKLDSITLGDAKDFERWLGTGQAREKSYVDVKKSEGLAPNTARKRVSNAKQFFDDAFQRELIGKNPFAPLKGSVRSNRKRDYFVTRDEAEKVLEACPDAEWRLIFSLARFGGLRCPTETLALTWDDINWAENKFTVHSPKTERHEGADCRIVPLFPEIRQCLDELMETAPDRSKYVITLYRDANVNLRTHLQRIIKRASLKPWPKLFQNLRASRATELVNEHPAHVAAAWLGHSEVIAAKHYWQVTEEDFQRASKPAQNAAQYTHVMPRITSQGTETVHKETPQNQGNAVFSSVLALPSLGPTRLVS